MLPSGNARQLYLPRAGQHVTESEQAGSWQWQWGSFLSGLICTARLIMDFRELPTYGEAEFWGYNSSVTWFYSSWTLSFDAFSASFQDTLHLQLSVSSPSLSCVLYALAAGLAPILSYCVHLFSTIQGISEQFLRQHGCWSIYMPRSFPFNFLFLNSYHHHPHLSWFSVSILSSTVENSDMHISTIAAVGPTEASDRVFEQKRIWAL